jgi:LysM repeat protein
MRRIARSTLLSALKKALYVILSESASEESPGSNRGRDSSSQKTLLRMTFSFTVAPLVTWITALIVVLVFTFSSGVYAAPPAEDGTHVVQAGETLFGIAQRYGLTVDDIVKANNLTSANTIYVGQKLRIPSAAGAGTAGSVSASESDSTSADNASGTYIVQRGDTLSAIAAQHDVTIKEIAEASGISVSSILRVGQKLTIPKKDAPAAVAPAPAPEPKPEPVPEIYVVQPGDTLAGIAERFHTSVASLARANHLSSPSLVFVGRRLIVPEPQIAQPSGGGKRVEVSISRQRCYVYDDDVLLYEWVCSTGRSSSPTQAGSFYIQSKMRKAYASRWNIWMPYWLGVYWAGGTENGFHGLPWNARTGRETWTGLVGTRITYGCIMLSNENAETLWNMAYVGMPIIIEY